MNDTKTVVIIGAGPAGLTAAYKLLKDTDYKPLILEESNFIGGISRTAEYNGKRMDIGGHRFFTKNEEVNALWNEIMPVQGAPSMDDKKLGIEKPLAKGGPDPETEERVMLVRNRVSRIYFLRKFFDYPISLKPETFKNMGFARTMKSGFGYIGSSIHKRKENSLEDFYINRFGRPLYEMFFEDYTEKLWGVHPSKLSADWGAQRVKGLSLMGAVWNAISKPFRSKEKVETSLIEQFTYPKKGPGQLWETLAELVREMGGEIRMNTAVDRIDTDAESGRILAVYAGNERFEGEYYISSMPVKDLVEGMGETVPKNIREIASALPYRDFMTVGLLVDRLNLVNKTQHKTLGDIVPDCWIYIQERDVRLGRLQIFNNWSPYMNPDPENTVWIGLEYFCNQGDEMWNMSDADFIEMAVAELIKIGVINKENVLDATRIRVKKAYPAYFGSYLQFDAVRKYLDGFENLYCVGRNGQHRYNNMDHSMLTAMETVRAITGKASRSDVWAVNTEKEYHEEKREES